jgi:hypothetical protein
MCSVSLGIDDGVNVKAAGGGFARQTTESIGESLLLVWSQVL